VDLSGKITLANKSGNIVARHKGNKLHLHGYTVNVDGRSFWNFTSKRGKRVNWSAIAGSGDWFAEPQNGYGVLVYAYRGQYPKRFSAEQPLGNEYSYYIAYTFSLKTGQINGNFGVDSKRRVKLDQKTGPGETTFLVSSLWGAPSDVTTGDYLQAKSYFEAIINPSKNNQSGSSVDSVIDISAPKKYKIKFIDKITNFNPSTDTVEIDTDSFGIDSSATFAAAKNKRKLKKLAKQDFDFLYDQKKGGLYFNENGSGKGLGEGGIIAILKGSPDLTASNLEFV